MFLNICSHLSFRPLGSTRASCTPPLPHPDCHACCRHLLAGGGHQWPSVLGGSFLSNPSSLGNKKSPAAQTREGLLPSPCPPPPPWRGSSSPSPSPVVFQRPVGVKGSASIELLVSVGREPGEVLCPSPALPQEGFCRAPSLPSEPREGTRRRCHGWAAPVSPTPVGLTPLCSPTLRLGQLAEGRLNQSFSPIFPWGSVFWLR